MRSLTQIWLGPVGADGWARRLGARGWSCWLWGVRGTRRWALRPRRPAVRSRAGDAFDAVALAALPQGVAEARGAVALALRGVEAAQVSRQGGIGLGPRALGTARCQAW